LDLKEHSPGLVENTETVRDVVGGYDEFDWFADLDLYSAWGQSEMIVVNAYAENPRRSWRRPVETIMPRNERRKGYDVHSKGDENQSIEVAFLVLLDFDQ